MSSNTSIQSPSTNNILIDGRMPFNCSLGVPKGSTCSAGSPYSKFRVQTGKTYKLRLVNSGAGSLLYFSIDNHQLTVISNDFVDVQPYDVNQVVLGTGQRSDVLFTPQGNGTIWMRTIAFGKFCGATRALQTRAKAIIFLNDTPETASLPSTTAWPDPIDNGLCSNVSFLYIVFFSTLADL
jgi:FtsP/CotA-like multicopper oxidase with cupredoxin domain